VSRKLFSESAQKRHRVNQQRHADVPSKTGKRKWTPLPTRSKHGFFRVGNAEGRNLRQGPGNRKVPMTMPAVHLPPAYGDDE
jgi:hypothetical protein